MLNLLRQHVAFSAGAITVLFAGLQIVALVFVYVPMHCRLSKYWGDEKKRPRIAFHFFLCFTQIQGRGLRGSLIKVL